MPNLDRHGEPSDLDPAFERRLDSALERRLDHALETAPAFHIPEDFADRVVAHIPAGAPLPQPRQLFSRSSIVLSAATLIAAIPILAPHALTGATFAIAIEWILCAQLSLVALYVARPDSSWQSHT